MARDLCRAGDPALAQRFMQSGRSPEQPRFMNPAGSTKVGEHSTTVAEIDAGLASPEIVLRSGAEAVWIMMTYRCSSW